MVFAVVGHEDLSVQLHGTGDIISSYQQCPVPVPCWNLCTCNKDFIITIIMGVGSNFKVEGTFPATPITTHCEEKWGGGGRVY